MNPVQLKEKGTILSIAGTIDHLHIICSKALFNQHTGKISVLTVNISSVKNSVFDDTCVLHAGDHPFIKHDSYVRYKDAVLMDHQTTIDRIRSGEIKVLSDVSDSVYTRVLAGFRQSPRTPRTIIKFMNVHKL